MSSLEKLKDLIHDYSDLLLAIIITSAMVVVVFWNLNTIFEEPAVSSAITPPSAQKNDSEERTNEDSTFVTIDLSEEEFSNDETGDTEETVEAEDVDESTPDTESTVTVVIPSGTPGMGIATILVEQGLLPEPGVFVQAAEELNLSLNLKSGTYDIPKDSSPEEMVRIIAGQE